MEGRTRLRVEGNNTQVVCVCVLVRMTETHTLKLLIPLFTLQVVTKMSPEDDRITSNDLLRPSKVNSLFAYTTPPGKSLEKTLLFIDLFIHRLCRQMSLHSSFSSDAMIINR